MITKTTLLCVVTFLLLSCSIGQTEDAQVNQYLNLDWAMNSLWDDGKAEVAIYDAERVVYGKPRSFEYVYILVKEDFNKEFQVKTDTYDRDDLYPVMKANLFCRIPTDAYPYHYLTSVFYKRENPGEVHKLTNTSQEWCGNTAKSFVDKGKNYQFDYQSYWDGQGNGSARVAGGVWFEDQLSYTLRTLNFAEGLTFDQVLYPSQISSKAIVPQAEAAQFTVTKAAPEELAELPAGLIRQPWKISVSRAEGPDLNYWINGEGENLLLKMNSTDGRSLTLKSVTRDAYWERE